MKERELQKSQSSNFLVNMKIFEYSKIRIFNLFHEWGKIENHARVTFKNPSFRSLCELRIHIYDRFLPNTFIIYTFYK